MNKIISILLYCICVLNGYGQFSYLIPTEKESILFERLYFDNEKYVVPFDFASPEGSRGAILIVDNENFTEIDHENINLGLNPMAFINDTPYLVGAPVGSNTNMRIIQLSQDFYHQDQVYDYDIIGERTINSGFASIGDTLYVVNVNDLDEDGRVPRMLQLWMVDKDGKLLHTKSLNDHARSTYSHELLNHQKGLLNAASINYYNRLGSYLSLIHLDKDGNEIWHFEGNEAFTDGATNVTAATLSNSAIVVAYEVNRRDDVEFIINNWNRRPIRLKWFDKSGKPIREKYIIGPELQELFYTNIEEGKGDYFFAYGEKVILEHRSAVITKFSNEGDTIWSHNYRHENFIGANPAYQRVIDVYEHKDKSITVLAEILEPGKFPIAWLFKIGKDGCYETGFCEDDIIVGDLSDSPSINEIELSIYPNPSNNIVFLRSDSDLKIQESIIYAANGQFISKVSIDPLEKSLDISFLQQGAYFLSIKTDSGPYTVPFLKIDPTY